MQEVYGCCHGGVVAWMRIKPFTSVDVGSVKWIASFHIVSTNLDEKESIDVVGFMSHLLGNAFNCY